MDKLLSLLDKLKYALSLLDSNELVLFLIAVAAYHVVLLAVLFVLFRGSASLRIRALQAELNDSKKQEEIREASWKDREEELRRLLAIEKDREISQIRAEYDAYVGLLEQKLMRSKTRQV